VVGLHPAHFEDRGVRIAGKLLTDKRVAANVDETIANGKQISTKANAIVANIQQNDLPDVHSTLENAKDMSHHMNQAVGTFLSPGNGKENTAEVLRDAAQGAQNATTNLADDTEAIKHNFFLRGFFNRRGFYDLQTLTPEKYASTEFVKKPRARVWIPAPGLFDTRPDGSQALSQVGPSIIDQYMSELVPYLPNNPIVVEGYSNTGAPDQQYLISRQRAEEVSRYLQTHFQLSPERVGAMPLGDHPLAGKRTWDGVCLVLVVSKK
jgi:phospholipid/cholesterol/gamma-HCH transport system substrate-binding protein